MRGNPQFTIAKGEQSVSVAWERRCFPPTSPGQPRTRRCERCGSEYEVRARTQRYCPRCGGRR